MLNTYFVAAYASSPSPSQWDAKAEAGYFESLAAHPQVVGIEHPFLLDTPRYPLPFLKSYVPDHWSMMITTLPQFMQFGQQCPDIGLASQNEESRVLAVQYMQKVCEYVATLEDAFSKQMVKAIHFPSLPKNTDEHLRGKMSAFQRSLEEIAQMSWGNVALNIEHCDAYRPAQGVEKGGLLLSEEIAAIQSVGGFGIVLNWARSVIEYQNVMGAVQHIQEAMDANLLKGFFYSGCKADWKDGHTSPLETGCLLDVPAVLAIKKTLASDIYLGIKISPYLNVNEVIRFLD